MRIFVAKAVKNTFLYVLLLSEIQTNVITSKCTLKRLRICCQSGWMKDFGFNETEIWNRLIKSGAAMTLILTKQYPTKIMILGRSKILVFLKYIWSQTLEWTHNVFKCTVLFKYFTNLCLKPNINPSQEILDQYYGTKWEDQLLPRTMLYFYRGFGGQFFQSYWVPKNILVEANN